MKYCNNCQAYKESWADKGHYGSSYDIRCWSCDRYTLSNSALTRPTSSSLVSGIGTSTAQELMNKSNADSSSTGVDYKKATNDSQTGDYHAEILQYDKKSGDLHYEYVRYRRS